MPAGCSSAGIIVRTSVFSLPLSLLASVGRCHSHVPPANSHLVGVDEMPPSSAAVHLYATDAGSNDYKDLAVDTFQDYKTKFENGDITADDLTKAVQEKTAQVAEFAKDSFELIKEKTAQVTPEQAEVEANTKAMVDDIVIDIKDISEAAAESEAN